MKAFGVAIVALALVIGIVPQFTDCQSQGKAITLASGKTVAMKCHWSARAELALAVPLLGVGLLSLVSKGREAKRALGFMSILLGAVVALVPTGNLIGVCAAGSMGNTPLCNSVMQPTMALAGGLVAVLGVVALVLSRGNDPIA
jgi:hypothetical protein